MSSEAKSYFIGFLFFIVFGLVELTQHGVFIFPFFLVAPVALGITAYTLIKQKSIPSVYNILLVVALTAITLVTDFIPMMFDTVPDFLTQSYYVNGIILAIGICWVLAYFIFCISIAKKNKNTLGYVILILSTLVLWIAFDLSNAFILQGVFVLSNILVLIFLKRNVSEIFKDKQVIIFHATVLFYNSLEFINSYGGYFIR